MGHSKEKSKLCHAPRQFINDWPEYGLSILSNYYKNVKDEPLIDVLGVSTSGAVFLVAHDYSNIYKTTYNIV
jgi:hypothetical protein